MGELLMQTERAKGARTIGGGDGAGGHMLLPPADAPPTLTALGLTKRESASAQGVASMLSRAGKSANGSFP